MAPKKPAIKQDPVPPAPGKHLVVMSASDAAARATIATQAATAAQAATAESAVTRRSAIRTSAATPTTAKTRELIPRAPSSKAQPRVPLKVPGHDADPRLAIPTLKILNAQIVDCFRCPRLVAYREQVALMRRRAFLNWRYWGRPIPGYGDPHARLYIIGLAPAAHGGNRTGRIFTGDRSGDFLFRALYETGFANQPTSTHRGDGLRLHDTYIGAAIRCAPPANKPLPSELQNCRPFFERELTLLKPKVVLALGGIALRAYLGMLRDAGLIASFAPYRFAHNQSYPFPPPLPRLVLSYHPSQQNTFTGVLTPAMLNQVLRRIKRYIEKAP